MSFKDFLFALECANKGFKEDFKNNMYHASFTAWQINEMIKAITQGNNNKGLSFNDYVKHLGIDEEKKKQPKSKAEIQIERTKALENAKAIVQLDRKGRNKQP